MLELVQHLHIISSEDKIINIEANKHEASMRVVFYVECVLIWTCVKTTFLKKELIRLYHVRGDCFSPYKAFFNLYTLFSSPSFKKPGVVQHTLLLGEHHLKKQILHPFEKASIYFVLQEK